MRVLLLNPPAASTISRDYYCGHASKSNYCWPPFDLLVISSLLNNDCFELLVIDAIAEHLDSLQVFKQINQYKPDSIVGLISNISYDTDKLFYLKTKERYQIPTYLSGDSARSRPLNLLQDTGVDGIIYHFALNNLKEVLLATNDHHFINIITKDHAEQLIKKNSDSIKYGIPRHDLFPLQKYRIPHGIRPLFSVVGSDFSCPHHCSFCFFENIPYSQRDLKEFQLELAYLQSININEILLSDASFGLSQDRALEICSIFSSFPKKFAWICEIRANNVTQSLIYKMKDAGCHTMMIGIEANSQTTLDRTNKGIKLQQISDAVHICKNAGIRVLGHFIIGFPWESENDILDTIQMSLDLQLDIASFNIYRHTSGSSIAKDSPQTLSKKKINQLKRIAYRRFYFRLSYILKQLFCIKSLHQLRVMTLEALHLIRNN